MYFTYTYYYLTGILLLLILIKTILYIGSTSKHNLSNWFFFDTTAIYNSRNVRSRKLKVLQNRLTLVILVITVIYVIAMWLL
ncbi:MAG TPA: hypothetical protein VHB70_04715 [Parafilimonas sp.]|nr:hypothetical protein [Parafilimonas sp.]